MAEVKVTTLREHLLEQAQGDLLPWPEQLAAAENFNLTCREVEEATLEAGLLPARYQRNRNTISTEQQLILLKSKVAVIGCGGLGGYIIEELARLGVGTLAAIDPDVFEEHNLNRQLLSNPGALGRPKVELALERVGTVNPAVKLIPVKDAFTRANGAEILQGADIVVDALDSISCRLDLADVCGELGVPLVHGTIAGWYGQVTTQFPGEDTIKKLYGRCEQDKGVEKKLGNPAFTPAVVASFEVAEVCKVLLGQGTTLRQRMLHINLLDMEIEEIGI